MTAETSVPSTALLAGADRDGSNYTARHLLVLEGLEAVRKRPGMYIGSTDSRGLMHCLWEIIDNSVDEALGGYCDHIEVILHDDGSVEVRDNGRGIPVDVEPKTGLSGVEVVMTKLHAGGKFGGGSYAASGGLHGVGASVVNALSARLDVEVDRERPHPRDQLPARRPRRLRRRRPRRRVRRRERPAQGQAGSPRPAPAPACGTGPTGRSSSRTPSSPWRRCTQRARQTAFLVPGPDHRRPRRARPGDGGSKRRGDLPLRRRHQRVLRVPGPRQGRSATCCGCTGQGTFKETVPVLDDQGHMTPTEVNRELGVDIALRWGTGYDTDAPVVRQHHRHAQGRHPRHRLRARRRQDDQRGAARREAAARRRGRHRQGRRPRGPDRGRHRTPGRAAVRGPDQGGARHLGGLPHRRAPWSPRSSRRS